MVLSASSIISEKLSGYLASKYVNKCKRSSLLSACRRATRKLAAVSEVSAMRHDSRAGAGSVVKRRTRGRLAVACHPIGSRDMPSCSPSRCVIGPGLGLRAQSHRSARQVGRPGDHLYRYSGVADHAAAVAERVAVCELGRAGRRRPCHRTRTFPAAWLSDPTLLCGEVGQHLIEGISDGFVPGIVARHRHLIDQIVAIDSGAAIAEMRRLARQHGLFAGPSSGANMLAARQLQAGQPGLRHIVTFFCDEGEKYLSDHFTSA